MSFEMRGGCERCGLALAEGGAVFDFSYECTFCERCTARARFGGRTIICPPGTATRSGSCWRNSASPSSGSGTT